MNIKLKILKYLFICIWGILILAIAFMFEGRDKMLLQIAITIGVLLTSSIYFNKKENEVEERE